MSATEEGSKTGAEAAASGAGHDGHEAFDGEPVQELSEGEPRSPLWLPALGIALFVVFGLYLAMGDDDETAAGGAAGSAQPSTAASVDETGKLVQPPPGLKRPPAQPQNPARSDVDRIRDGLRKVRGGDASKPPARPVKPHVHKPGDVH